MRTEALVDVLRKTLIRHRHILPTSTQRDSRCRILNQGEYLVSLLSNDESLLIYLRLACNSVLGRGEWGYGNEEEGVTFTGSLRDNFDLWVDCVKFVWLLHGASEALNLIRESGFAEWSHIPKSQRHKYVDTLVLLAQKRFRNVGLKFTDYAEFFADGVSAKALTPKH
jgi:hypothetical protein